ncbi:MAG: hypothetical protein R2727_08720 [Bacteroidales bacterium]
MIAPRSDPRVAGSRRIVPSPNSKTFCFLNENAPTMLWSRTPTRLVPFATFAGRPRNISRGRVNNEPLPARVFINPAIIPTTIIAG